MFKLYKNGNYTTKNATFDYICDSVEDLENIPKSKSNLGSSAIIIDEEEGVRVYMCNSKDIWVEITDDIDSIIEGDGETSSGESSYVLTKEKINKALGTDILAAIEQVKETLETKNDEVSNANNEIASNKSAIAENVEKISANENAIEQANEKISANEEAISEANEKISANEEAIAAHDERIEKLEKRPAQTVSAGGNYELIKEIVCDGTYAAILINEDETGEELNLQKAYLEFSMTKPETTASIRIMANDIVVGNVTNGIPLTATDSNPSMSSAKISIDGGMIEALTSSTYQSVANVELRNYGNLLKGSNIESITSINVVSSSASVNFPVGSAIKVYGIKG